MKGLRERKLFGESLELVLLVLVGRVVVNEEVGRYVLGRIE